MGTAGERLDLADLLAQDPGIPRAYPTTSFWQSPSHPLATAQSVSLPPTTDIAVIGSGVTGAAVTKTLLEQHDTARVTVFEARELCSGATGRNGGQLAINAAENYVRVRRDVGAEMAGKMIHFSLATLREMRAIARDFGQPDPELHEVNKVRIFRDDALLKRAVEGVAALEADHPELRGIYRVLDADECRQASLGQQHGISKVVGALSHAAGSVWPYRIVTGVFQAMLERFPSRLAVEANTPVVEVDYQPETEGNFSYLVQTGRGTVRCKKVVYCTNAYTGRLLPALRGLLFPLKGTMTVQDLGVAVDNTAPSTSWAIHYAPFEEKDGTLADGLIYGIQNSRTGQYFFGGEKTAVSDMLSTDDTFVSQSSVAFLQDSLRTLFVQDSESETTASDLVASWSGIMCFSSDGMPLVGRLSESVTGRKGSEEWLCCAYSGYGMPVAWLAGENLAAMILDKPLHEHFPESYLITEKRLRDKLSLQKSVEHLLEI